MPDAELVAVAKALARPAAAPSPGRSRGTAPGLAAGQEGVQEEGCSEEAADALGGTGKQECEPGEGLQGSWFMV